MPFLRKCYPQLPGLADFNVLYLGSHVLHQLRLLHAEVIQDKPGLSVHMACLAGMYASPVMARFRLA